MRSQLCRCETHDRKFARSQPLSRRFATACSVSSSGPHFQVIPKSNRIVVLTVVRTVDKRHRASARRRQDWITRFRMSIQFGFVTFLKFTPFPRIMTEPLAQLSTGCNVLQPAIMITPISDMIFSVLPVKRRIRTTPTRPGGIAIRMMNGSTNDLNCAIKIR